MNINFVAPAFGFQKNTPYPDNAALRSLIEKQWAVCRAFDASIGFHSGSGKSAENYQVMGAGHGRPSRDQDERPLHLRDGCGALPASKNPADAALWRDWYRFTLEMALAGAFSSDATEQKMARVFITTRLLQAIAAGCLRVAGHLPRRARGAAAEPGTHVLLRIQLPLCACRRRTAEKAALGDHSPAGYAQRARFYAISAEARLNFAKAIAKYIIFLAERTPASHTLVRAQAPARGSSAIERSGRCLTIFRHPTPNNSLSH